MYQRRLFLCDHICAFMQTMRNCKTAWHNGILFSVRFGINYMQAYKQLVKAWLHREELIRVFERAVSRFFSSPFVLACISMPCGTLEISERGVNVITKELATTGYRTMIGWPKLGVMQEFRITADSKTTVPVKTHHLISEADQVWQMDCKTTFSFCQGRMMVSLFSSRKCVN